MVLGAELDSRQVGLVKKATVLGGIVPQVAPVW
jgi:hypothetical protein